jgi:hypothetical protein
MQRASHGTRGERMVNRVGAEICRAVVLACWIAGAIAAEAAAAGRARERRRPAAARMRNGRPAAEMPAAASGKPSPATMEAASTTAAEMCAATVPATTKVCAATVETATAVATSAMTAATAMTATAPSGRIGGG